MLICYSFVIYVSINNRKYNKDLYNFEKKTIDETICTLFFAC